MRGAGYVAGYRFTVTDVSEASGQVRISWRWEADGSDPAVARIAGVLRNPAGYVETNSAAMPVSLRAESGATYAYGAAGFDWRETPSGTFVFTVDGRVEPGRLTLRIVDDEIAML